MLLYKTKKLGYKNWAMAERNPIIRAMVEKFGLHKGIRIASVFTILVVVGIIFYFNWRTNWLDFSRIMFFCIGFYTFISVMHIYSFKALREEENAKKQKRK
jgi:ABC-type branched-subunit amino acid transport system permease subunit